MIWKIETEALEGETPESAGRYWKKIEDGGVTLLLDCGDGLRGWRMPALGACFAESVDTPLPIPAGEAAGEFAWERIGPGEAEVVLLDESEPLRLSARALDELPPNVHGALTELLAETRTEPETLTTLVRDGIAARTRAIERFCGLGRELDGESFDAPVWRKALSGMALDDIHTQLRALEVRFDLKHPPAPVSSPEPLDDEPERGARHASALRIVRG